MQEEVQSIRLVEAGERCLAFLRSHGITLAGKRSLLAVSGGMDSMCMLHVIHATGVEIAVAHVNYSLRGEDSDADEACVQAVCRNLDIEVYTHRIDLQGYLEKHGGNLQEAGRELRYAWFEMLCGAHGFDYVCTAHQQDDSAESFFINVIRGTGVRGLTGIPVMRDRVLRPMLCFTRAEIVQIVLDAQVPYRDDTSNWSTDYLRNRVRQQIIPACIAERPRFISQMSETQHRLRAEYNLLQEYLTQLRGTLLVWDGKRLEIDLADLLNTASPHLVLYALVSEYGYNLHQCSDLVSAHHRAPVKYLSPSHIMYRERTAIHIVRNTEQHDAGLLLSTPPGVYVLPDGTLRIEVHSGEMTFSADPNREYIDTSAISGGWKLRRWEPGDAFNPLHGPGRQKLQDYFTNEKLSQQQKQSTWLLTADEEIVWIVGRRLDDRYQVKPDSPEVWRLAWEPLFT